MTRRSVALAASLFLLGAVPLAAQTSAPRDTSASSRAAAPVAADSAVAELGRAVAILAATVQKVVAETANDPAVRLAAVRVAGQAVTLAQQTLDQQMGDVERMLAEASRMLEAAAASQAARVEQKPAPKPRR